jgi:hypothetical protein
MQLHMRHTRAMPWSISGAGTPPKAISANGEEVDAGLRKGRWKRRTAARDPIEQGRTSPYGRKGSRDRSRTYFIDNSAGEPAAERSEVAQV